MPAPENNRFAAKPASERADSQLQVRVRVADKANWVRAAKARGKRLPEAGNKLAGWVIDSLNAAAAAELER